MIDTFARRWIAQLRRLAMRTALLFCAITVMSITGTRSFADEPIKVGLLLTYVGPTAIFARYEDKGARLLIEQVNKAGGVNGRQIEVVGYDTEGKPDRAGVLFRRLAEEDHVPVVIGPDSIYIALGMSSIPAQVNVFSLTAAGGYEFINPVDRSHISSSWAAPGYANALVLAYFKDQLKVKRIGIITTADTIGQATANEYAAVAKLLGIEVAQIVSQPATDRDLLPSLRQLASLKPAIDGLMVYGSGPFGSIAVNQTELAGLDVPIGYGGGNIIPELIKDIGPDVGKHLFVAISRVAAPGTLPKSDPYYDEIQNFAAAYKAKYNEDPTVPSAVGYDMAATAVDALKAVGPDAQKIRDYISGKQKNLLGAQGVKFNRSPSDGYGVDMKDHIVVSVEGGKFVHKGYLLDSLKKIGVTDEAIRAQMRELKLLTE